MENTLVIFYVLLAIWIVVSIYETVGTYKLLKYDVLEPFDLQRFIGMSVIEMFKSFIAVLVLTAVLGASVYLLELIAEKMK